MRTGYDLVALAAERTPDHVAIVDDRSGRQLTYRDMIREVDVIAADLAGCGVRQGDRIATALPNALEHCFALLALQRLGAVPAFLNFRLPVAQLAETIAEGEMTGAILSHDVTAMAAVREVLPRGGVLLTVGGPNGNPCDFGMCRGDVASLPPVPKPLPDDTAYIFYTSGTTGKPKGALLAHRTTEFRISSLSPITGLRAGTDLRSLGVLPLFHGIGFYCVFMTTLVYNGTYFLMSSFDPDTAIDMIERHCINFVFAVPTVLQAMVSSPGYRPHRVASLEYVFHGGSAITPTLLEQLCTEWNARVHHLYGTTETYIPLCNSAPRGAPSMLASVYPHRTRVVRIGGGPDDIVTPGEAGELIVDANNDCIFSAYLNAPELTAQKVRDGWYFTGDVCMRREDGKVDFVGRVDDAIRSGGESIYPTEIEQVLLAHPAVEEVCVVGLPERYWGEQVVACVVARKTELNARELDEYCRSAVLAGFKRPRRYVFVASLPRNASNKVLRRELRNILVRGDEQRLCA